LSRYLLLPKSDAWYAGLFRGGSCRVCGETTPAYALLDDRVIARIAGLDPELKLIYLLRNPPERQVMVGFFDEIVATPGPFLRKVYRFPEVDDDPRYVPKDVQRPRNARPDRGRIRRDVHRPLAAAYLPRLEQVDRRFANSYTAAWLALARQWSKSS
jgi:hypothetical protein